MKIKDLLLIVTGLFVASCSNNSDFFPSFDDNCDDAARGSDLTAYVTDPCDRSFLLQGSYKP